MSGTCITVHDPNPILPLHATTHMSGLSLRGSGAVDASSSASRLGAIVMLSHLHEGEGVHVMWVWVGGVAIRAGP